MRLQKFIVKDNSINGLKNGYDILLVNDIDKKIQHYKNGKLHGNQKIYYDNILFKSIDYYYDYRHGMEIIYNYDTDEVDLITIWQWDKSYKEELTKFINKIYISAIFIFSFIFSLVIYQSLPLSLLMFHNSYPELPFLNDIDISYHRLQLLNDINNITALILINLNL